MRRENGSLNVQQPEYPNLEKPKPSARKMLQTKAGKDDPNTSGGGERDDGTGDGDTGTGGNEIPQVSPDPRSQNSETNLMQDDPPPGEDAVSQPEPKTCGEAEDVGTFTCGDGINVDPSQRENFCNIEEEICEEEDKQTCCPDEESSEGNGSDKVENDFDENDLDGNDLGEDDPVLKKSGQTCEDHECNHPKVRISDLTTPCRSKHDCERECCEDDVGDDRSDSSPPKAMIKSVLKERKPVEHHHKHKHAKKSGNKRKDVHLRNKHHQKKRNDHDDDHHDGGHDVDHHHGDDDNDNHEGDDHGHEDPDADSGDKADAAGAFAHHDDEKADGEDGIDPAEDDEE